MDSQLIAIWIGITLLAILIALTVHFGERTKGRNVLWHLIMAGIAALVGWLCPNDVSDILFSDSVIVIIGVVFPIYHSIRAVCTPATDDDMVWLQYWCAMGTVYFIASYLNDYSLASEHVQLIFRQCEFWFFLWLYLPMTDGSSLVYEFITLPYLLPIIQPAALGMSDVITKLYQGAINIVHLGILWVFFMLLPHQLERLVAISVGSIYPLMASVVAVSTESSDDDTYWLTYWSCYGCLFVFVDCIDTYVGKIPGFYTLFILCTVYLMLPMFQGSEKVFRNVLVPLAGLQEMLILRDAIYLKKEMYNKLPSHRHHYVKSAISKAFGGSGSNGDDDDDDHDELFHTTGAITRKKSKFYLFGSPDATAEEKDPIV